MPKRDIMIKPAGPDDLQALLDLYRHLNPMIQRSIPPGQATASQPSSPNRA
ncbi:hypothetical protein ACVJBD_001019 [Rhizobium mongolense]